MATKTWKLGEVCKGGIITVETKGNKVAIIGKEWDHAKGDRRSSDQSGAKEWTRLEVNVDDVNADRELREFLQDLSTYYHADNIMKWIESKTKLLFYTSINNRLHWK